MWLDSKLQTWILISATEQICETLAWTAAVISELSQSYLKAITTRSYHCTPRQRQWYLAHESRCTDVTYKFEMNSFYTWQVHSSEWLVLALIIWKLLLCRRCIYHYICTTLQTLSLRTTPFTMASPALQWKWMSWLLNLNLCYPEQIHGCVQIKGQSLAGCLTELIACFF